jgi:hypothetical protein
LFVGNSQLRPWVSKRIKPFPIPDVPILVGAGGAGGGDGLVGAGLGYVGGNVGGPGMFTGGAAQGAGRSATFSGRIGGFRGRLISSGGGSAPPGTCVGLGDEGVIVVGTGFEASAPGAQAPSVDFGTG